MKVSIFLLVSVGVFFDPYLNTICNFVTATFHSKPRDTPLTTIQRSGRTGEAHTVQTKDGYLLTMHRILPRNQNGTKQKFPIFLQHGILGSSMDFLIIGPENSLAFLLSDFGFDVWLGNFRGNTYSRHHISLSPNDIKFWQFSWHESGIYDLPAQIDYVLNHTKSKKLLYLGYSMGTTAFFVMTSTVPEYNDKIEKAFLMTPVAYLTHIKSPLVKAMAPTAASIKKFEDIFFHGEFLRHSWFVQKLSEFTCKLNLFKVSLCANLIYMLAGVNPAGYDAEVLSNFFKYFPAGYSTKGVYHFGQIFKSGQFRQYDYGPKNNKQHYQNINPPLYNLSAIRADMNFYVGKGDYLGTVEDANRLVGELSTLKKFHLVQDPHFNHLDFVLGRDVKTLLYDHILKDIQDHLKE